MVRIAGVALYLHIFSLLLVLAAIIPVQIVRAHLEGKLRHQKFGEEYRWYQRRTWF